MNNENKKIKGGLYLIVDPQPGLNHILPIVEAALQGGVDVIQLWSNSTHDFQGDSILAICKIACRFNVPVLIYEKWEWLRTMPLDGVHFDKIPGNWEAIKKYIDRPFLAGLTCGNDLERINWAIENQLDYISFCSMYSSSTVDTCETVKPEIVQQTRLTSDIPIFASGGVTPERIYNLRLMGVSGIAVVSAISKARDPEVAARNFKYHLLAELQK